MTRQFTLTITASSHPEFDLYANIEINGFHFGQHGNRAEIDKFTDDLVRTAAKSDARIAVIDES